MSEPRLRLLGTCELTSGGRAEPLTAARWAQALVYIAAQRQWVPRERLAALFWPDRSRDAGLRNVRKVTHLIAASPLRLPLETRIDAVRCLLPTDVAELEAAVAAGKLAEADALYRGEFAPGLEGDAEAPLAEWLRAERTRLAALWRSAALQLARNTPDATRAMALVSRVLESDPLDEEAAAVALETLRSDGRSAEALRLYQQFAARVAGELGIEPSARLRSLVAPAATGDRAEPSADAFIGRRLEMQQVAQHMAGGAHRALVLHGPGGIGKSRLARELLMRHAPQFSDGAGWVALEDLSSEVQVPARIAQATGVRLRDAGDGLARLIRELGTRHQLLVFDNAEHLPGIGAALARLLRGCPRTWMLVTSRTRPAGLEAEVLTLAGLDVPDDESLDEAAAAPFDAVRLFVERARLQQPSFTLAPHVDAVIQIVRSVQGMPLAIQMAAAWVRLLPPQEIARELLGSIAVLEHDLAGSALARSEHASMRAVLERSFALLAPAERDAMLRTSVFVGGFTREAAQIVADVSLPLLASLVDKSLVQAHREQARFSLHPLLASYGRALLAMDPVLEARTFDNHRGYFAGWLKRVNVTGRFDAGHLLREVGPEIGNCRQAWERSVAGAVPALVADLSPGLANFMENSGRHAEGEALLSQALALDERQAQCGRALAEVYRGLATLQFRAGQLDRAQTYARQGLRAARLARSGPVLIACLNLLGLSHWQRNQFAEALPYYEAALKQAERDGDEYGVQVFTSNLGMVHREMGAFDRSREMCERALGLARKLGNQRGVIILLNNLGNHYRLFEDWQQAARLYREGLALADQARTDGLRIMFLVNLGLLEVENGSPEAAEPFLREVVEAEGRGAEPHLVVAAWVGLARAAARRHEFERAFALLAEAMHRVRASAGTLHELEPVVAMAELTALTGDLPRAQGLVGAVLSDQRLDATTRVMAERLRAALLQRDAVRGPDGQATLSVDAALDDLLRRYPWSGPLQTTRATTTQSH